MDYTKPGWYHKITLEKLTGPKVKITATAGLHMMKGNPLPYFSITGEILTKQRGRWEMEACGALPDLGKDFPELAEVAPLHGSDINGQPMHAEANGWYWLAGYLGGAGERFHGGNSNHPKRDKGECLRLFAGHMRYSSIEQVIDTIEYLMLWQGRAVHNKDKCIGRLMLGEREKWQPVRQAFARLVQNQLPRWKDEADKAIAILDKLAADKERGK